MRIKEKLDSLRKKYIEFLINDPGGPFTVISNLNWERHLRGVESVLDFVPKNGRILDVGCGGGHTTCISKILRDDIDIFGLDIEKKYFWKEFTNYNVNFLLCNVENSCFKDQIFDVVISFGVIEHTKNPDNFLKEIRRMLKNNGYFFVFDLPTKYSFSEAFLARIIQIFSGKKLFFHERRYTKKEVESLFSRNGFSVSIKEEFFIPTQIDRVSRFLGEIFNKNYKKIDKIDKLILKTPIKFFSQSFMLQAKKL